MNKFIKECFILIKQTSYCYLILICLLISLIGCQQENCYLENDEYGNPIMLTCIIDEAKRYYCFEKYHDNGNVKLSFCEKNKKILGEKTEFYPAGNIKSLCVYKNGLKNGYCQFFYENGKLDSKVNYKNDLRHGSVMEYFENGLTKAIKFYTDNKLNYGKFFQYDNDSLSYNEVFDPNINFVTDSLKKNENTFRFRVVLPVPDSVIRGRKLIYKYDVKPLEFKDSVLVNPRFEMVLNNRPVWRSFKLDKIETQLFYGYVQIGNEIFNPYEKKIIVIDE